MLLARIFLRSAVLAALAYNGANAAAFNAVDYFSLAGNPNGTWTYLADGTVLGSTFNPCEGHTGLACWWNGQPPLSSAIIGKNTTGSALTFGLVTVPADHLELDPDSIANVTVRWTAPAAGTYAITADFLGLNVNEQAHTIEVDENGVKVSNLSNMDSQGQDDPFSATLPLSSGATIDFVVHTGFGSDETALLDTGLAANIALVPEPSAVLLLSSALLGFAVMRRRL
jgi:hypothetical protein